MGKKLTRSRAATVLAALGMLVMSSGVALMASASPASAAKTPVNICHATSSDTNPYVFITVDDDSTKLQGHLMHRNSPNKHWKSAGTYEGVAHLAGDPKPDLIGDYTDSHGVFHKLDGNITKASCDGVVVENPPAVADVDFIEPTCANGNTADWDGIGDHVTFAVTSGTVAPGNEVTITATADEGFTFDGESTTETFTHTFNEAQSDCGTPSPPSVVTPGDVSFTDPTCDTNATVVLPNPAPPVIGPSRHATGPVLQTKDVDGVHYVVSGSLAPGGTVTVDATAILPAVLAEGVTSHWEHTFPALGDCGGTVVSPPTTSTPGTVVSTPESVVKTPTLVHAGLASAVQQDLRGQQGLALLVVGAMFMVAAGGLGLTRTRTTRV